MLSVRRPLRLSVPFRVLSCISWFSLSFAVPSVLSFDVGSWTFDVRCSRRSPLAAGTWEAPERADPLPRLPLPQLGIRQSEIGNSFTFSCIELPDPGSYPLRSLRSSGLAMLHLDQQSGKGGLDTSPDGGSLLSISRPTTQATALIPRRRPAFIRSLGPADRAQTDFVFCREMLNW